MEFKKRLRTRLIFAIIFAIFGAGCIVTSFFAENEYLSSLGLVFLVLGIARVVQYKRITRNEESLNKRMIAETDERNVMLWTKARSLAFTVYILLAASGIIVLNILKLHSYADVLSCMLFGFLGIYWICYFIVSRKG